jgi:hypothetical protein
MNVHGQEVLTHSLYLDHMIEINLPLGISSGIYFLRVISKEINVVKKLVIAR